MPLPIERKVTPDHEASLWLPHNRPVLSLCYSILLRSVRNYQLSLNALMSAECIELLGGILTPIVRSQHSDLPPRLLLHKGFEPLEDSQHK